MARMEPGGYSRGEVSVGCGRNGSLGRAYGLDR